MPDSNALERVPPVKRASLAERSAAISAYYGAKINFALTAAAYSAVPQILLNPLSRAQTLFQVQNGLRLPTNHRSKSTMDALLCKH